MQDFPQYITTQSVDSKHNTVQQNNAIQLTVLVCLA